MKRLILLVALIGSLLCASAQQSLNLDRETYSVSVGQKDPITHQYNYSEERLLNIMMHIKGAAIILDDDLGSVYYTTKTIYKKKDICIWNAWDEKHYACIVKASWNPVEGRDNFTVYYGKNNQTCIVYQLKNKDE